ncbi:MAG: hypothetical protein A2104_02315 [Candidatus Melainabacteria bacterium GWF2_32_7]|nr:MAG: hypothetical protein A2104_02315 [Candidatus Melainabacteria bacterium GWF2_32_7]
MAIFGNLNVEGKAIVRKMDKGGYYVQGNNLVINPVDPNKPLNLKAKGDDIGIFGSKKSNNLDLIGDRFSVETYNGNDSIKIAGNKSVIDLGEGSEDKIDGMGNSNLIRHTHEDPPPFSEIPNGPIYNFNLEGHYNKLQDTYRDNK